MERIAKLREMLKGSPTDCFLLHAMALEHIKTGDILSGIRYFQEVLQTDENYVGSYYHLAKAFEQSGQIDDAVACYEKGLLVARRLKDQHAANELQMALDELTP